MWQGAITGLMVVFGAALIGAFLGEGDFLDKLRDRPGIWVTVLLIAGVYELHKIRKR